MGIFEPFRAIGYIHNEYGSLQRLVVTVSVGKAFQIYTMDAPFLCLEVPLVLMSASADNSLKMWIFDTNDGDPRLLRFRSGHSAPPLCIRFWWSTVTKTQIMWNGLKP